MRSSRSIRCVLLLAFGVTACSGGTPRPAPGRPPAPVEEYWAPAEAQAAFDRVTETLTALEIQYTQHAVSSPPDDPQLAVMAEALRASRARLASLPNPAVAQIVFAERLDRALDGRLRALAVEQRLLLARVTPGAPEAQRMARVVAAMVARRDALHADQAVLHATYRSEPTIAAGEWIRLTLPPADGRGTQRAQGRVVAMRNDSLFWKPNGLAPPAVQLPSGATIERVASRRGHASEGALLGLVTGTVIGRTNRGTGDDEQDIRGLVFGAIGTVVGALVGSTVLSEQWVPVWWANGRVVAAPSGPGLGIQWSLPRRTLDR